MQSVLNSQLEMVISEEAERIPKLAKHARKGAGNSVSLLRVWASMESDKAVMVVRHASVKGKKRPQKYEYSVLERLCRRSNEKLGTVHEKMPEESGLPQQNTSSIPQSSS